MRMFRNDLRLVHGDGNGNVLCPFRRKCEHVIARDIDREGRARREREIVRRLAVQRIGDVDLRILRCRPGECELIARRDLRFVRFRRDDGRGILLLGVIAPAGSEGKRHTAHQSQRRGREQSTLFHHSDLPFCFILLRKFRRFHHFSSFGSEGSRPPQSQ